MIKQRHLLRSKPFTCTFEQSYKLPWKCKKTDFLSQTFCTQIVKYYTNICVEALSKTVKRLSKNSRCPGWELNSGLLEYEAVEPTARLWLSIRCESDLKEGGELWETVWGSWASWQKQEDGVSFVTFRKLAVRYLQGLQVVSYCMQEVQTFGVASRSLWSECNIFFVNAMYLILKVTVEPSPKIRPSVSDLKTPRNNATGDVELTILSPVFIGRSWVSILAHRCALCIEFFRGFLLLDQGNAAEYLKTCFVLPFVIHLPV
jgi:hypothetical protein